MGSAFTVSLRTSGVVITVLAAFWGQASQKLSPFPARCYQGGQVLPKLTKQFWKKGITPSEIPTGRV